MEEFRITAYLAGWSKEFGYRKIVKDKYGDKVNVIDPMTIDHFQVIDNVGKNEYATYIIRRDKKLIDKSDILVAYIKIGATYGTIMEIMYAYERGIPVYVIDPTAGMEITDDAWVRFHCKKRFNSIEECFDYILSK